MPLALKNAGNLKFDRAVAVRSCVTRLFSEWKDKLLNRLRKREKNGEKLDESGPLDHPFQGPSSFTLGTIDSLRFHPQTAESNFSSASVGSLGKNRDDGVDNEKILVRTDFRRRRQSPADRPGPWMRAGCVSAATVRRRRKGTRFRRENLTKKSFELSASDEADYRSSGKEKKKKKDKKK